MVGSKTPTEFDARPTLRAPQPNDAKPLAVQETAHGPVAKAFDLGVTEHLAEHTKAFGAGQRPRRRQVLRDLVERMQPSKRIEVRRFEDVELDTFGNQALHGNVGQLLHTSDPAST